LHLTFSGGAWRIRCGDKIVDMKTDKGAAQAIDPRLNEK
jgi:hypothetical protein